jgi:hypothetical protein
MGDVSQNVGYSADSPTGRSGRVPGTGERREALTGTPDYGRIGERQMEGFKKLASVVYGRSAWINLPVDLDESTLLEVLKEMESYNFREFDQNVKMMRAHLRYLAALWPDLSVAQVADRIHALIDNRDMSFSDVMTVLRGESLSERAQMQDLRMVLRGQHLGTGESITNEVPIASIQAIGRALRDGVTMADTARTVGVSLDTVRAIEEFLGLRSAYQQRLLDTAIDAVREGTMSIRTFATQHNLTKTTASRLLDKARSVLRELGEL